MQTLVQLLVRLAWQEFELLPQSVPNQIRYRRSPSAAPLKVPEIAGLARQAVDHFEHQRQRRHRALHTLPPRAAVMVVASTGLL